MLLIRIAILAMLIITPLIAQTAKGRQIDFLLAGTIKSNGQPNSAGKVYFWQSSSKTSAKTVYSDALKTTPITQPVILDARGAATVFGDGEYYAELYDKSNILIKTYTSIAYGDTSGLDNLIVNVGASYGYGYSSILSALTAVGSARKTLLFANGTFNVTDDLTFPVNTSVIVMNTASFNVSSGKTLTFNGSFSAPNVQVFYGSGTSTVNRTINAQISQSWFGGTGESLYTTTFGTNGNVDVAGDLYVADAVGIGTTSVSNKLQVSGNAGLVGNLIVTGNSSVVGNSTVTGISITTGTSNVVGTSTVTGGFTVTGTSNFVGTATVTGTSNVVGTATVTGESTVTGTSNVVGIFDVTGTSNFTGRLNTTGTSYFHTNDSPPFLGSYSNSTHAGESLFLSSSPSATQYYTSAVLAFGKPDGALRRTGSAIASFMSGTDVDQQGLAFFTSSGSGSTQTLNSPMNISHQGTVAIGGVLYSDSSIGLAAINKDVQFSTGSNTGFYYKYTSDRVGIGTTTPAAKLDVSGNVSVLGATEIVGNLSTTGNVSVLGATEIVGNLSTTGNVDFIVGGTGRFSATSAKGGLYYNGSTGRVGVNMDPGMPKMELAVSGNAFITGDIYTVSRTTVIGLTLTGWSSTSTYNVVFKKIGKTAIIYFSIEGTSNSSTATLQLPSSFAPDPGYINSYISAIIVANNGVPGIGGARVDSVSNVLRFDPASAPWVASGTKNVGGQIIYETAQ